MMDQARIDALLKKHGLDGVNKPKLTPNHPKKKGVVLAKEGDKVKLIRFGAQGYKHNYSPRARAAFKQRHAKNIAKGKMSAAYWADKLLWSGPKGHKVTKENPKKKARHEMAEGWAEKYKAKYGESGGSLKKIAKATGHSESELQKVFDRGLAAARGKDVKAHGYALARVYSYVLGGPARKVDKGVVDEQKRLMGLAESRADWRVD